VSEGAQPGDDGGGAGAAPPAEVAPRAPGGGFTFLDEEPAVDGRAAGEALSGQYRNPGGQGGSFGTSRRLNRRERSPRNLLPLERPAVATIRYIIERQELLKRRAGRYGNLGEMARGADFRLDVPHGPQSFQRRGYRFEMEGDGETFKVTATALGPNGRSFTGDDSGIIRVGLE
jgi:hypothetical protein